jgi:hypothetical protein
MSDATDKLRAAAKEDAATAVEIIASTTFVSDVRSQVAAIVAGVAARTATMLADALDAMATTQQSPLQRATSAIVARNHKLREAAINGDWNELERIARDGASESTEERAPD